MSHSGHRATRQALPAWARSPLVRLLMVSSMSLPMALTARADGVPLRTLDGRDTTLAAQVDAGRWTLVMMWTTYCGVCRRQYPVVSAFHDRHHDRDARVVGIALDGYEALDDVRAYVAKKPFTFPTVVGEADTIGAAFTQATGDPFTGTPTYLLFNPARQLVAAKSGDVTLDALERSISQERP